MNRWKYVLVGLLVGAFAFPLVWNSDPSVIGQTVTVDSTQSPLVVNAVADLADLTPTDGQSVIIKTGTEKGLWYYDKDSAAVVDGVAVLTGPGSVGRFLVISNDIGSIAAATAITAAQIDNDVDVEFGVFDADSPRSLTLAELKKTANIVTVSNVAALYALTYAIDNQLYQTLGHTTEGVGANLYRYDSGSSATPDYGFTLDGIGGNGTGTGTGRFIAVDRSVVRITHFGARNAIGSDDGVAIQRAIDAAEAMVVASGGSWGGYVLFDVQWCQFTTQLTVEQNGIVIRGLGSGATQVRYVSATGAAITFSKGATGISQCGIESIRMQCTDTAGTKQGIVFNGAQECFVRDVYCPNWQGTDAVFLQVSGHEMMEFTKLDITATIPIRISESPIGSAIDCDHFHFTDCLLRHGSSTKAGHISALVWAHVLIDAGVYVSNLTFDGSNAFVGGEYGIYQSRTDTTKSVNHNISIKHARFEQPAESTGYAIYLAGNASVYTQSILLEGIRASSGMKGIFIDYAINARITDYVSAITTNALTVDHLAHLEISNIYLTSGAAAMSMGTMTMLHGDRMSGGYGPTDYFSNAVWTSGGAAKAADVAIEASTAGSGAPNVLIGDESNKLLTNEGTTAANYHTLPTAVAGLTYTFVVQDADGMRITGATGDTIRLGPNVTATAGYIESTTIGDVVTVTAINATEWVGHAYGTWTNGTWSYALADTP